MTRNVTVTVTERGGRRYASTGSPWEPVVGYSRAVRTGDVITVTGTVGIEADGSFAPTMKGQTRRALEIILAAVEALGGRASDVVRTRLFVTDVSCWQEVGEAHGEVFGQVRPATTMVEISRLIDDAAFIEIEADAIVAADH
jgi:enamine deaminase RidA (YjgF/YER057c/UK114 family)